MTMAWLDPVREEFRKRLQGDRLAHAFLLSGQAGTGKQVLKIRVGEVEFGDSTFGSC